MKINTSRFGELTVSDDEKIVFTNGIFGFENFKDYILLNEEESMFSWLQSLDNEELAFVLVKPVDFYHNYILDIDEPDVRDLRLESDNETVIYSIVVIPDDTSQMTANLQGPIVINLTKNIAKQVISLNPRHKLRHNILEELQKKTEKDKSSSGKESD